MRELIFLLTILVHSSILADVILEKIEYEPITLSDVSVPVITGINAAPSREPSFSAGLILKIDGVKFYIKPAMFMSKSKPDEVCTPNGVVFAYQCKEGQRFAASCHLLFFDSQGKWVGWNTLKINEKKAPTFATLYPP